MNAPRRDLTSVIALTASRLIAEGFIPVPITPGKKNPASGPGWPDIRYTQEDDLDQIFTERHGVGLNLENLVDIDLDSSWARKLAPVFLPDTGMIWGRRSSPRSHYAYQVTGTVEHKTYERPDRSMLLERRTGKGHQSVVPPSLHPSGELITWATGNGHYAPAVVDASTLCQAVGRLAAAALMLSVWQKDSRQALALAFAGFLLKARMSQADVEYLIGIVEHETEDSEVEKRLDAVRGTAEKLEAGLPVSGAKALLDLLPEHAQAVMVKLTDWLGLRPSASGDRPIVLTTGRDWKDITEDVFTEIVKRNAETPEVFQRGGELTRVRMDEQGVPHLETFNAPSLAGYLTRELQFTERRGKTYVPIQPSEFVVKDLLSRPSWPGIAPLRDIVEAPVFAKDGTLLVTPGYHPAAQLWFRAAPGFQVTPPDATPSQADVDAAKALLLNETLSDFPFADEASRAHTLAAMLLPFVRELIDGPTPLHLFDAPTPGSGKGLLADVVATVALGRSAEKLSVPGTEDEWRKRITAQLLRGAPIIVIDNVKARLESEALCTVLTGESWGDRVLGVSEMTGRLPNRALWLATGNNVALASDMARRTVWIRLAPDQERPWERSGFHHANLLRWVREHRGELVRACLILVQAWIAAGRPVGAHSIGSFESWAEVLGGVLAYAGVPGFLGNYHALYEQADEEMAPWREFVGAWWEKYQGTKVRARELYLLAKAGDMLLEERGDGTEQAQVAKLGRELSRYQDRIIGGYRVKAGVMAGKKTYRLEG